MSPLTAGKFTSTGEAVWTAPATTHRPTFPFCGHFSGKEGISALRWLKRLEWELEPYGTIKRLDWELLPYGPNGEISPKLLMKSINVLLTGEAAAWAETCHEALSLLSIENPDVQDVKRFKSLFQARFPAQSDGSTAQSHGSTSTTFEDELRALVQMESESLSDYYVRVSIMMESVGAKDRNPRFSPESTLTRPESTILNMVIRAFVKGLTNDVQREATGKLNYADCSLHEVYEVALQATRRPHVVLEKEQTRPWGHHASLGHPSERIGGAWGSSYTPASHESNLSSHTPRGW